VLTRHQIQSLVAGGLLCLNIDLGIELKCKQSKVIRLHAGALVAETEAFFQHSLDLHHSATYNSSAFALHSMNNIKPRF